MAWETPTRWPQGIEHLNGVPFSEAPLPPVVHECWAQTSGRDGARRLLRCACGAISDGSGWAFKNERRTDGPS